MSTMVTLYRGIRTTADQLDAVKAAHLNGPLKSNGTFGYLFSRLPVAERLRLEQLDEIVLEDTRPKHLEKTGWVFASGDLLGAEHYAIRHGGGLSRGEIPLLIELSVDLDALVIDGRDFLYTLASRRHKPPVRAALEVIYGSECLRLLDRAKTDTEAIPRTDLVCQHPAVIEHHLAHRGVVAGRMNTLFRSSFMFHPSEATAVVEDIWVPTEYQPRPEPDYSVLDLYHA